MSIDPCKIALMSAAVLGIMCGLKNDASTHGGRLNSEGCHNNRKTGGYHCHRGSGGGGGGSTRSSSTRSSKPTRPKMGVVVLPKAAVYIDGTYAGVSPIKSHRFEAGQRDFKLRIVHPLLGEHTRTVKIEPDIEMHIRWSP